MDTEDKTNLDAEFAADSVVQQERPAKKAFVKAKDKELSVFTHAKKLCEYCLKTTANANKKYRSTVLPSFIDTVYKISKLLYVANSTEDNAARLIIQREIDANAKFFSFLTTTIQACSIITKRQSAHIANLIMLMRKALWQWINSNPEYKK
jgi:hypothetical protein